MDTKLIKDIFCAAEQKETPHQGAIDGNGEFVFTCTTKDCNRFLKFPTEVTPEQFNALLTAHKEENQGQVSVEELNKKLSALINGVSLKNTEDSEA